MADFYVIQYQLIICYFAFRKGYCPVYEPTPMITTQMETELTSHDSLRTVLDKLVPLSDSEWHLIRSSFVQRMVDAKTLLTKEGEVTHELFFIQSGLARLFYQTDDNEQMTSFIFFENMFASCLESFLQKIPSNQNLETLEPCVVLTITRDALEALYVECPKVNIIMRKVLEQRFIASQRLLSQYILKSPQERYEQLLGNNPQLLQRVPQNIIATFLGITPVSLSRIRKRISKG